MQVTALHELHQKVRKDMALPKKTKDEEKEKTKQFNIMNKMHEDRKQNIAETREDKSKTEKKTAVNGNTPRARRSPQKDLLIGSSLIKDIKEDKLINTKMICIRGASLRNISDELNDLNSTIKNITIVAGENDCSSDSALKQIETDYNKIIENAKRKCNGNLMLSSIPPRMDNDKTLTKIEKVNNFIKKRSIQSNCKFINDDAFFKLADGSTNDCLLMADRVHLTWQATNRLAKHLQLNTQGDCISKLKIKRDSQPTRHADSRKKDNYTHTSNNHHTNSPNTRPHRHHSNRRPLTTQNGNEWQQCEQQKNETDYWCTYCNAYGHSSRQCRGYY